MRLKNKDEVIVRETTFSAKDGSEINKVTIPIKFAQHGGSGL